MADPPELHEDVELDMERRRYVLDTYAELDSLSHYDVLGVVPTADKKTIKRAYFRLAAVNHPDRYFSKRLGSYKAKLEAIFARTTEAFETLIAPDRRARYDTQRAGGKTGPGGAAGSRAPVDPATAAKRAEALEALKRRFSENQSKAKQHVAAAARARAAGDLATAAEEYEMALTFTPRDTAVQAAHAECVKESSTKLADSAERQALLEERFGQWAEAAESWKRVAKARPDDPKVKERLAAALSRAAGGLRG